MTFATSVGQLA